MADAKETPTPEAPKPSQEDLLKACSDVLDEAIAEYERLSKMGLGIDGAEHVDDMKHAGKGIVGEGAGPKPAMAKDKEKDKDHDKDKDDDEKLVQTYKSLVAKMEERGLFHKSEVEPVKDEPAPESDLRKSVDERFDALTKAIKDVSESVKKIAAAPVARKGVTSAAKPLKKSEDGGEGASLSKNAVLIKLLELKKTDRDAVDSAFINRIETGRVSQADVSRLRALGIAE